MTEVDRISMSNNYISEISHKWNTFICKIENIDDGSVFTLEKSLNNPSRDLFLGHLWWILKREYSMGKSVSDLSHWIDAFLNSRFINLTEDERNNLMSESQGISVNPQEIIIQESLDSIVDAYFMTHWYPTSRDEWMSDLHALLSIVRKKYVYSGMSEIYDRWIYFFFVIDGKIYPINLEYQK